MPQHNEYQILSSVDPPEMAIERDAFVFRFLDLNENAQKKFARILKRHSSIWTVKSKAKERDILTTLTVLNPTLLHGGYGGGFSGSTLLRWREKIFSQLIYHSQFRREANMDHWRAKYLLSTPHF